MPSHEFNKKNENKEINGKTACRPKNGGEKAVLTSENVEISARHR